MGKYRKKPVVVEAHQTDVPLDIVTLEGTMRADVGDWIITGVKGEQYPCKPDVFDATYEPAGNEVGPGVKVLERALEIAQAGPLRYEIESYIAQARAEMEGEAHA